MKYLALLRGINVGGNSLIKMDKLKEVFINNGFTEVTTYIQSGNVIFDTEETNKEKITKEIEQFLQSYFKLTIHVVVLSQEQLKKILDSIPDEWKTPNDLRCYIAFVREPMTSSEVLKEVTLNDEVDSVKTEKGVLYFSTKLSGLTKSSFSRLAAKKIYKEITIRNFNTTQKLLEIMKK